MWDDSAGQWSELEIQQRHIEHLAFLQANLVTLGIDDPMVRVVFGITSRRPERNRNAEFEMNLSEAVHHQVFYDWPRAISRTCIDKVDFDPKILVGGEHVGYLDMRGFRFTNPSSFRHALAWMIVAQCERSLFTFDMNKTLGELLSIVAKGVTEEIFVEEWLPALKRVFSLDSGLMFSDGYKASENYLWRAATKDVHGEAHPGYPACVERAYVLSIL